MGMSTLTPSSSWHPPSTSLAEYATGRPTAVTAASVEAHLVACAECRRAVAPLAPSAVVEAGRVGQRSALQRPRAPWAVRLARRAGLSDPDAVLLTASSALRDSWIVSVVVVLGFAAAAPSFAGGLGDAAFLVIAPLVPVVGVALVYAGTEPTIEAIAGAAPYSQLRLLLLRTVAVLVTTLPLVALAALLARGAGWAMVGWLLPSLAFTAAVLALSTWLAVEVAAPVVALLWTGTVCAAAFHQSAQAVVSAAVQPLYLVLAAGAAAVVAVQVRRGHTPGGIA
jgi:hypothetical protein